MLGLLWESPYDLSDNTAALGFICRLSSSISTKAADVESSGAFKAKRLILTSRGLDREKISGQWSRTCISRTWKPSRINSFLSSRARQSVSFHIELLTLYPISRQTFTSENSPRLLCNYQWPVRTRNQLRNPWQFLNSEHTGRQRVILQGACLTDPSTFCRQHAWPYGAHARFGTGVHNVLRLC